MVSSILRKIQVTGGSTLIVSLPKEWAKNNQLKNGDYVVMNILPDGSLRITPVEKDTRIHETTMTVSEDTSSNVAIREFISRYLAGYDVIRVLFIGETQRQREALKSLISSKTIGVEIVEETADEMIIQCLAKASELPVKTAIRRMTNTSISMLKDSLSCLDNPDKRLLRDIVMRDEIIDKFYLFIVRQLKSVTLGLLLPTDIGLDDLRACLGYRIVAKALERIGDHAQRIASSIMQIDKITSQDILENVKKLGEEVLSLLAKSVNTLLKCNTREAHKVIDNVEKIRHHENTIIEALLANHDMQLRGGVAIRTITESLKRIADYSADIAEITLNLGVETPRTRTISCSTT